MSWVVEAVNHDGKRLVVRLRSGETIRVGYMDAGELAVLLRTSPPLFDGRTSGR